MCKANKRNAFWLVDSWVCWNTTLWYCSCNVCGYVCVWERVCVCVCVRKRGWERVCMRIGFYGIWHSNIAPVMIVGLCVCERECVRECVCAGRIHTIHTHSLTTSTHNALDFQGEYTQSPWLVDMGWLRLGEYTQWESVYVQSEYTQWESVYVQGEYTQSPWLVDMGWLRLVGSLKA